jgi:alpha-amylase/alpha-mannosidase (GH57 family)
MLNLSVHGHFYQPPRENPYTGIIPQEDGAYPFKNWNERITFECYEPMAQLGNFERMSFNLGPTLAAWLETAFPATYERIIEADKKNVERNGVGNAIAQVYNHTILPLADYNDKITQIRWGLADFELRFGRKPAAMWLAECTVDYPTLEALAECGLEYVILAEWQAQGREVDVSQPYLVPLPSGRTITAFFFHGALAWHIHDERLNDPQLFAKYSLPIAWNRAKARRNQAQHVMTACDGEYFGHHFKGRAHWLAEFLNKYAPDAGWKVTYPGLYLRDNPPKETIKIEERTAWSCFHGLNRWASRCECEIEDFKVDTPQWKGGLRTALNSLASRLDEVFVKETSGLLKDAWETRHRYSSVILNQTPLETFVENELGANATPENRRKLELLLQSQFMRQWMFTSCAWFFEDLSRIEPKNNIIYASRALGYVRDATGVDLETEFVRDLEASTSWRVGKNGAQLYEEIVRAAPVPA